MPNPPEENEEVTDAEVYEAFREFFDLVDQIVRAETTKGLRQIINGTETDEDV